MFFLLGKSSDFIAVAQYAGRLSVRPARHSLIFMLLFFLTKLKPCMNLKFEYDTVIVPVCDGHMQTLPVEMSRMNP